MPTFHINGRIVSSSNNSFSSNSSSIDINPNNKIRITYASSIFISGDSDSFKNESTRPELPQTLINYISKSVTLNTVQQPEQKNNQVVFAAFSKNKTTRFVAIPCTSDIQDAQHPDDPCYTCFYGQWIHRNNLYPTKCGEYVATANGDCLYISYDTTPCTTCDPTDGEVYDCLENCEKCNNGICTNTCKDGYLCAGTKEDHKCKKKCLIQDCDSLKCERCINGFCESLCSSGSICRFGICEELCFPPCDKNKCEKCELINGTYACVSLPGQDKYGQGLACCNGEPFPYNDDTGCRTFNTTTCEYSDCPPGTICTTETNSNLPPSCIKICNDDSDCDSSCCGKCTPLQLDSEIYIPDQEVATIKACVVCGSEHFACVDGVCKGENEVNDLLTSNLQCNGCQTIKLKNTPECIDKEFSRCFTTNCYECVDECSNLAKQYNRPFRCETQPSGKLECKTYEPEIIIASYNFIP